MRNHPSKRERWLLPVVVALFLAAIEAIRLALGHPLPFAGAVALLGVIYTAYRLGVVPGVTLASLICLYIIRAADAGTTIPEPGLIIAILSVTALVGWLSSKEKSTLADALAAREQAQLSEARYRDLVDGLDAVVWEADADSFRVRLVSKRAEAMFGYSTAEWLGSAHIWRRIIHPSDFDRVINECRKSVVEGRDHDLEYRAVTRYGETIYIRDIVQLDRTIVPAVLRGVLFDVSKEHFANEALHDTERRLREFINNAPDALLVHDAHGRVIEVNRRACDSLGYLRDEFIGMHIADFDVKLAGSDSRAWLIGKSNEGLFRTRSGRLMPVEIAVSVWENDPPVYIAVARDITHKAQLEAQLRQSQRMEAVGRLAGGIAHDFNNLLTAIRGHTEFLRNEITPQAVSDLDQIITSVDRAAALTHQLLAFSRRQMLQLKVLDLSAVVKETEKLFGRWIGEDISIVTTLESEELAVEADRSQLEQVLMNLVLNARDAMPKGGRITIRTARAILTEVDADRYAFIKPGSYVMMSVADDGVGMEPDVAARIFEPFFTTKEQGKGFGLGLATAYGIVKQLGGYIWCDSTPGEGTLFRVYLPPARGDAKPEPLTTPAVRTQLRRGNETILVVEDEPAVRSLVRRVLQKQGYNVLDAGNGVEAMRVATELHDRIHLLLTDVVMPEMNGHDLAEKLGPARPDMKILFMSGYAEDAIVVDHILQPGFAFLPKPFAPDALAAKVRETLES